MISANFHRDPDYKPLPVYAPIPAVFVVHTIAYRSEHGDAQEACSSYKKAERRTTKRPEYANPPPPNETQAIDRGRWPRYTTILVAE
jgi:hypothetical protein